MPTLARPTDLFDREHEWEELSNFVSDTTPGLRIGIVYGRRRQGKSYPLRRLAAATGGFYYQALEHEPLQALAELGDRLGAHLGVGRLALADWDEAVLSLGRLASHPHSGSLSSTLGGGSVAGGPAVAVIDEFPYLLERSPELPSLLQRAVDRSKEESWPAVRLVLCGSAISVMAELLEGQGALRGRVHTNLLMRPFSYLDAKRFWAIADPRLAFRVDAILGGTPGYRELVRSTPSSLADLDDWVVDEVLSPASALFREDEWLLGEQRGMENRALYLSVLAAVAEGNGTQTAIANKLGRSQQSVLHPLDALVRSGFLEKDDDVVRQRRPVYRIADPIIRFHQVVRHPRTALFEDRRGIEAWADAHTSFDSLVLGPHLEHLAREHVRRVGERQFGAPIVSVGTTVINDRDERAAHELDIVALGPGTGPQHRVIEAIGEAKLRQIHSEDLARLDRVGAALRGAHDVRIVLASASGFSAQLIGQAESRPEVHLVGLEEIYS
ncbi:MAG: ATP-binding protein [Acidimicrobiales bacterium]